jgi:hypothetical protein
MRKPSSLPALIFIIIFGLGLGLASSLYSEAN